MSQTARRQQSPLRLTDTEAKAHPFGIILVATTLVLGALAFATAMVTQTGGADLHLVCSWAGLAGVVAGGWGQMISATTGERFLLILGLGAAAFGLLLGMAYGGPFGGLLG